MEPLSFGQIMNALNNNPQFYDPNGYGPKGEPALTSKEKAMICGKITKDMKECLEANGPDFFTEIWNWIRKELARVNWFMRGYTGKKAGELLGPWVVWRVVYKKASKLTEIIMKEKQPKTIHQAAKEAVNDVDAAMKKAMERSGATESFE